MRIEEIREADLRFARRTYSRPVYLTLKWQTNYNGISLHVDWEKTKAVNPDFHWPSPSVGSLTSKLEQAFAEVADTLPDKTHEWGDYDEDGEPRNTTLTKEQIKELIADAKEIIEPVIPTAVITFEYDHYSH